MRAVVSVVRRQNTEMDEGRGTYIPAMATAPRPILNPRVRRGEFGSRPFARTVLPYRPAIADLESRSVVVRVRSGCSRRARAGANLGGPVRLGVATLRECRYPAEQREELEATPSDRPGGAVKRRRAASSSMRSAPRPGGARDAPYVDGADAPADWTYNPPPPRDSRRVPSQPVRHHAWYESPAGTSAREIQGGTEGGGGDVAGGGELPAMTTNVSA